MVNRHHGAALLDRFQQHFKEKMSPFDEEKNALIKIMHEFTPARHRWTKFNEFCYKLLPHPAYSPDLVPWDYFLFPNLKKWFGGKRFITREQLIAETEAYFEGLDKSYYSGLKRLENL